MVPPEVCAEHDVSLTDRGCWVCSMRYACSVCHAHMGSALCNCMALHGNVYYYKIGGDI